METKAEIRKRIRAARDAMSSDVREAKSRLICEQLRQAANEKKGQSLFLIPRVGCAFTVAVYAAMGSEASLDAFTREAYTRGWRVCFPAMVGRSTGDDAVAQPMAFFEVSREAWAASASDGEAVAAGDRAALGGAEVPFLAHPTRIFDAEARRRAAAAGVIEVDPREIDCMVVPMVAFDDAGTRLGYGGGNYDRYLPRLREDALVLGAAFEEQRVRDPLPLDEHDVPLARIASA